MTPSSYGPSEDETCRQFVLPALDRAGWKEEQIRVQYPINKGRIVNIHPCDLGDA